MYKNFIFDLYGTLIDINTNEWKYSLWKNMSYYYKFNGASYKPTELKNAYEKSCVDFRNKVPRDKYEKYPDIVIEEVFKFLYEKKGIKASVDLALQTGKIFRVLSTKYIKLYDGITDMLQSIKNEGGKIFLLSNAQRIFTEPEMKLLDLEKYFDGILLSSDWGCSKPDYKYYDLIFKKYNLNKEESIMIGNDWKSDIQGAYNYGIDSLYIHSNISPEIQGNLLSTYTIMDGDFKKMKEILLENIKIN